MSKQCSVPGCGERYAAKGYCALHYHRWRRHGDPLITLTRHPRRNEDVEERLEHLTDRSGGAAACWPFLGDIKPNGYGSFMFGGRRDLAHRWAWKVANSSIIPAELVVRHKCDNRRCCNPRHLELGTPAENVADSFIRGGRGSRLGPAEVSVIRARRGHVTQRAVAAEFGVCVSTVRRIWLGRRVCDRLSVQP